MGNRQQLICKIAMFDQKGCNLCLKHLHKNFQGQTCNLSVGLPSFVDEYWPIIGPSPGIPWSNLSNLPCLAISSLSSFTHMGIGYNLVTLVNIKIAGIYGCSSH